MRLPAVPKMMRRRLSRAYGRVQSAVERAGEQLRKWADGDPRQVGETPSSVQRIAVVGFYSDDSEAATLRQTFESFAYGNRELFLFRAEREGEFHAISTELGEVPVACIHPRYRYPATYLDELMSKFTDPADDVVWTADTSVTTGGLGVGGNPDLYRSLVPTHVFRLLYSKANRHIAAKNRSKRTQGLAIRTCATTAIETHDGLPHPLHRLNGFHWVVDYAYRLDRKCIEAYFEMKGLDKRRLADDAEAFLASLTPIQYRHLLFFLNTNVAGERGADYVAKHLELAKLETVVDVGSGYGGLVKAFSRRGCRATGLEIMPSLMALARMNLAGTDAELVVGDFLEDSLPANTFDLVTMTDVIEHVADVDRAIARSVAVLRDGGYAYVKIPNYRFIDYIREDSHTGLFGITLLRHDPAAAYLKAVRNMGYSVGEYYDHDHYIETYTKYGATLVHADNVTSPDEDIPKLLEGAQQAFAAWEERPLEELHKDAVRAAATEYLAEFERKAKQPDALFRRDYLTSHWNMFFQKQPGSR